VVWFGRWSDSAQIPSTQAAGAQTTRAGRSLVSLPIYRLGWLLAEKKQEPSEVRDRIIAVRSVGRAIKD
jgi:hypothetical protein